MKVLSVELYCKLTACLCWIHLWKQDGEDKSSNIGVINSWKCNKTIKFLKLLACPSNTFDTRWFPRHNVHCYHMVLVGNWNAFCLCRGGYC